MSAGPDSPRSYSMSSSVPSRNAFSLLPPEELLPYVVPFSGGPGMLAGNNCCGSRAVCSYVKALIQAYESCDARVPTMPLSHPLTHAASLVLSHLLIF